MNNLNILVPVDFSELSQKAMKAANELAETFEGTVTPMHAYVPITELEGPYAVGLGPNLNEDYEEVEEALQNKLDGQASENIDKKYLKKGKITVGSPAQSIIETSKKFDMIAMSTHGRTGFTRLLLGSVAEKVLRLAEVPILVVEKQSIITPMERILVTTDLSRNSAAAFPYARKLAEKTGAKLDLINIVSTEHISSDQTVDTVISLREERLKVIAKEYFHTLANNKVRTEVIESNSAPHEAILNVTKQHLYNMVVMASIGHTGLDYLMLGSTATNVVRHVEAPVLSVRPEDEI